MALRIRHFTFSQKFKHPETGEELISIESVEKTLSKYKSIKKWAWAVHDEDTYTQHDFDKYVEQHKEEPKWKIGDLKDAHIHVVGELDNARNLEDIAKWFNVPSNMIKYHKGQGAFADDVVYLTHEAPKQQELGKHLYDRSIIKTNIEDIDSFIDDRLRNNTRKASGTQKDEIRYDVMFNGMSLKEVREKYPYEYCRDLEYLKKCRADYLLNSAVMPKWRINYYIDGLGGMGKDTCTRALAKALAIKFNLHDVNEETDLSDYVFTVGDGAVTFDGYDGQPIIIWNDMTAIDLITRFGSRKAVFNALNLEPNEANYNVKYGKMRLVNCINIFNGVQPYEDFLDGLAGEYTDKNGNRNKKEDKSQSYRRFPFIMCLREADFDLMMNKGVFEGTREYESYQFWKNVRGNFSKVAKKLDGMAAERVSMNMLTGVVTKSEELIENKSNYITNPDEIPEEFLNYGRTTEEILAEYINAIKSDYSSEELKEIIDYVNEDTLEDIIDNMIDINISIEENKNRIKAFVNKQKNGSIFD